jgi:hypothetical protein
MERATAESLGMWMQPSQKGRNEVLESLEALQEQVRILTEKVGNLEKGARETDN